MSLYNILPYPFKVVAASLEGMRLASIRYGKETDKLCEQALERETWSTERWKNWQAEQTANILQHAARNVPYYREQWATRRRAGDHSSIEELANWPILQKETLRSHPEAFIADGVRKRDLILGHTSGSSGSPLTFWLDRDSVSRWYALAEARWRAWYGLSHRDRWGMLGGKLVTPFEQTKPPFWVWNSGMNQLYLSTFHISRQFASAYIDALHKYQVLYILGFASSLYDLARFVIECGLAPPPLMAVISNSEGLYPFQRKMIRRAFNCPVVDTYGQAENVCAASECSAGNLHLWPEAGVTEVFLDDTDEPSPVMVTGRLIVTGLLNKSMPLIRYAVGDRASLGSAEEVCSCGRTLPMMHSLDGRTEDTLITADGRYVEPDTVFQESWPIHGGQIIQETRERFRILIIPAPGYDRGIAEQVIKRFRDRLGNLEFIVEEVADIPRTKGGKRKVLVSLINPHPGNNSDDGGREPSVG